MDEKEVYALINKAKGKLKSSEILIENNGYSDSVGLSYYAMFLSAKALLIKKDCDIPKSYKGLIQLFSLKYVREGEFEYSIYKYLADTQSLREEADYNAFDSIDERIAKKRFNQANKFIKESEKFI